MYFLSKKSYMATLKPPALSGDKLDGCAQANLLLPNAFSPLAIRSKFSLSCPKCLKSYLPTDILFS